MIESQYIDAYLTTTANPETRWTPDTYLAYTLGGSAKDWSAKYARALMRAVNRRVATGEVVAVRSVRGSTAYMRVEDCPRYTARGARAVLASLELEPGEVQRLMRAAREHGRARTGGGVIIAYAPGGRKLGGSYIVAGAS